MSNVQLVRALDQESAQIQSQITSLQDELEVINRLRVSRSGLELVSGGKATPSKKKTVKKPTKTKRTKNAMSSMDMARQVLDNNGGRKGFEMSFREIRDAIRPAFGVEPAKSLDQMLYKRGAAKKGFYRTPEGKYGRIEWLHSERKTA